MDLLRRLLASRDDRVPPAPAAPRPTAPTTPEERETTRRVRESLDARALELDLDTLVAQGLERVRVVDPATIERIVTDLLEQTIRRRGVTLTAEERAQVQDALRLRQRIEQLEDDNAWLERQRDDLERRVDDLERDKLALARQCEDLTTEVWALCRAHEERVPPPTPREVAPPPSTGA